MTSVLPSPLPCMPMSECLSAGRDDALPRWLRPDSIFDLLSEPPSSNRRAVDHGRPVERHSAYVDPTVTAVSSKLGLRHSVGRFRSRWVRRHANGRPVLRDWAYAR